MAIATEDDGEPAAEDRPEQERDEPFWVSFNQADAKLLLITFAGTVAANVVTVMVVAVGYVLTRLRINGGAVTGREIAVAVADLIASPLVFLLVLGAFRRKPRNPEMRRPRAITAFMVTLMILLGSGTVVSALFLAGQAAEIK